MSYLDSTIPADTEGVKLGASRIRALAAALNTIIAKIFDDSGNFLTKWVTGAAIANDATVDGNRAISSNHLQNGSVITRVLADGVLSADVTGQGKMANGFFTADTAGRAKFVDGFITLAKLAWGSFFSDAPSKVTPVGTDLILIGDSAGGAGNAAKVISIALAQQVNSFTGVEHTVAINSTITEAHGLVGVPKKVRWVLVCKTIDSGYSVGDEVDVTTVRNSSTQGAEVTAGANGTSVFLVLASAGNIQLYNFSTQAGVSITTANWKLKCYASLS